MKVEGVINLYKPIGHSSAWYAYRLRAILGEWHVGHAGALDPFADGVLLACVGKATRLVERLMGLPKQYETTLRLGVTNASFDPEQPFEAVPGAHDPGRAAIEAALAPLIGWVDQTPPTFSAVKVGGRPAYKRARAAFRRRAKQRAAEAAGDAAHAGEHTPLDENAVNTGGVPDPTAPPAADPLPPPRRVHIESIAIRRYEWPLLDLSVRCGRGTYIRAIARDIGHALGVGACCEALQRTAVGPFTITDAVPLWTATPEQVRAALRPVAEILERLGGPA